jgi:hypothetical protein
MILQLEITRLLKKASTMNEAKKKKKKKKKNKNKKQQRRAQVTYKI